MRGTIDGVTYSHNQYGYFASSKSGVDKARIMRDPVFQRTRENMSEFGSIVRAGKHLRHPLKILTALAGDQELNQRTVRLMAQIRNLDYTSDRGKRTVMAALADPAAAQLLVGFEFNDRSHLPNVLLKSLEVDAATGTIEIENLHVVNDILFPPSATHVTLISAWLRVDLDSGDYVRGISDAVVLARNAPVQTVTLAPPAAPSGSGVTLFVMRVGFSQLMNGVHYSLSGGEFNVVSVVGVG